MNIAYVTMLFPAPSEVFAMNDVRALIGAGHRVAIHSLRPAIPGTHRRLRDHGLSGLPVSYYSLRSAVRAVLLTLSRPRLTGAVLAWIFRKTWRRPAYLLRTLLLLPRVLEIFECLEAEPPDVVHLFWGHYPSIVGSLVIRHCPQVVTSVFLGAYDLTWGYGGSAEVARAADATWTHARVNLPAIRGLGVPEERIRVVYRGLDLSAIPSRTREPMTGQRIVTVGRLLPSKGFDAVLDAFARFHAGCPGSTLTIIGDGPDRRRLEQRVEELAIGGAVSFRGFLSHSAVLDELVESDIFLFLSRKDSERLPNVVKEAMACQCLCIVTETPGIDELVRDGVTGHIVEPGDHSRIEEHLRNALDRPEQARQVVARARAHVRRAFDVSACMCLYQEEWERLRREKAARPGARPLADGVAGRLAGGATER